MKIGVISDTHGSLLYFNMALKALGDCSYILHGGDILYHGPRNPLPQGYNPKELAEKINSLNNMVFTQGNCDAHVDQMVIDHPIQTPYVFLHIDRYKILLCHGFTKESSEYIEMAKKIKANIFIYGHTHIKSITKYHDLTIINPGSTALPKDGIHSAALIEDGTVKLIDIVKNKVIKECQL
ncbi:phosphodiesterase [Desulfofalx alkaliphila]|uniref:phosphodiesterase n=1 Tax=Desulfofalx alkaliphila TaxID=105483 RepID=UPI0004E258D5|nr:phosphodiesterase [Desulfofalx alkaliphila]